MEWELPTEGPKTLSGLIVEYLEDIPQTSLGMRIAGYPIEIIEIKENMIKQVKVFPQKRDTSK
jgi:Mg2+/Co2+ transporter CorB